MRCFAVLLTLFVLTKTTFAQDAAISSAVEASTGTAAVDQPLKIIDNSAAERPSTQPQTILPDCADERLQQLVRRQIAAYQSKQGENSLYDSRAQKLAVKNMTRFNEVSLDDFAPKDNYPVANRVIAYKINRRLTNSDMRLCRSDNPVLKNQLYLLLSPNAGAVQVDIINYGSPRSDADELHFTY